MDTPTWEESAPLDEGSGHAAPSTAQNIPTWEQSEPVENGADKEDNYQTAVAGLEGVARGVLSAPVATFAETKLLGVPEENILRRQKESPIAAGLGETAGLVGSLAIPFGQGALLEKAGVGAAKMLGLTAKAAETSSAAYKIGAEAVNQATQAALFTGGDEISKMLLNDPETSAQTAASHVGASLLLGSIGGAALGSISPIWKAAIGNKIAPELENMKGQALFRANNLDIPSAASTELKDMFENAHNIRTSLYSDEGGGITAQQIGKALPEVNEANNEKINGALKDAGTYLLDTMRTAANDVETQSKMPLLNQKFSILEEAASPTATYEQKFQAINDLKRDMQKRSRYQTTAEDTAFGALTKNLAAKLKPILEDSEVWGAAGDIQKKVNEAVTEHMTATKGLSGKFTVKGPDGLPMISEDKVNTFIKQAANDKAKDKIEVLKNYMGSTDKLVSTVNDIFTNQGLEAPINHTSTAVLGNITGNKSAGAKLIDTLIDKQLNSLMGKSVGGVAGGVIGYNIDTADPRRGAIVGSLLGEHALGPMLTSILPGINKSVMENATSSQGFKSALDYGVAVLKGDRALSKSALNVFKAGINVLTEKDKPNQESRDKLDKKVDAIHEMPNKLTEVDNGKLGHYMGQHQASLTATAARTVQYLNSIKPRTIQAGPLDTPTKPSIAQLNRYNRALDIAQNPNIIMSHIKEGTLQATDIADLQNMYPALQKSIAQKLNTEMTLAISKGQKVPYHTRMALSLFNGQQLDSTMMPANIQAAQPQNQPQANQQEPMGKKSAKGSKPLQKLPNNYKTPNQTAESDRSSRD